MGTRVWWIAGGGAAAGTVWQVHVNREGLRKANLSGASLRGANLADADLRGADLTGADLTDVLTDDTTRWPAGYRAS